MIQGLLWLGVEGYGMIESTIQAVRNPHSIYKKLQVYATNIRQAFLRAIALTPQEKQTLDRIYERLESYIKVAGKIEQDIIDRVKDFARRHEHVIRIGKLMLMTPICNLVPSVLHKALSLEDLLYEQIERVAGDDTEDNSDTNTNNSEKNQNPVGSGAYVEGIRHDAQNLCAPRRYARYTTQGMAVSKEKEKEVPASMAESKEMEAAIEAEARQKAEDLFEVQSIESQQKEHSTKKIHEEGWEVIEAGEEDGNWKWLERDTTRK